MKNKMISLVVLAAALSLNAGCARRTSELPPTPPSEMTPVGEDTTGQDQTGAVTPGSRADFLQSVPADRVFFGLDSYSLDSSARQTLDSQAEWLTRNQNVRVTIEGHADERGTREYNLALGDRRANAARDYLEARGVAPNRMQTLSWGKERPAVDGSNESAWAQNRRAVTVVPE
ncbi:MAG: peptidoglycan-associated lipoprotein Pal [Allosphingosinicella sp.]